MCHRQRCRCLARTAATVPELRALSQVGELLAGCLSRVRSRRACFDRWVSGLRLSFRAASAATSFINCGVWLTRFFTRISRGLPLLDFGLDPSLRDDKAGYM